jgi:hypothetical protein
MSDGWARQTATDHLPETAGVPAVHAGLRRDVRLDACRGLALWFIFIDHIPDNALNEGLMPAPVTSLIYPIYKSHLAPVRLLHFLALAVVVSRLAPPEWLGTMRPLMTAMIRCGENSLSMYCLGVLLSFMGHVILTDVSGDIAMQFVVSICGIAAMIFAATLLTWESQLDRRGPKLF